MPEDAIGVNISGDFHHSPEHNISEQSYGEHIVFWAKNQKYKKEKPALDQHCRQHPLSLDIVDQPQNVENVKSIKYIFLVLRESGVVGFNKAMFAEMFFLWIGYD